MSSYEISYDKQKQRITISLEGDFTLQDAKIYQAALIRQVAGLSVKTVLILQTQATFSPECMSVFQENAAIPELSDAVTAAVCASGLCQAMRSVSEQMPQADRASAPKPFDDLELANQYLDSIKS